MNAAPPEILMHVAAHGFKGFYVPRKNMPQIDAVNLPTLVADALAGKVSPTFEVVAPKTLHAHQRVCHAKAQSMPASIRMKPVLVSADDYVLDGNHRWWSNVHQHQEAMNIIRLQLTFDQALGWLFERPYTYRLTAETPIRN